MPLTFSMLYFGKFKKRIFVHLFTLESITSSKQLERKTFWMQELKDFLLESKVISYVSLPNENMLADVLENWLQHAVQIVQFDISP